MSARPLRPLGLLPVVEQVQRAWLRLQGVASRHRDTPTGRLHLYDAPGRGDGPPIVLLHGIAASANHYARVVPPLRRRFARVVVPDLPGHGFSDAPDPCTPEALLDGISALLDAEIGEPFVLFGNSLGGALAARYALRRPDRVRNLILCSPGGARMEEDELARFLKVFELTDATAAADFVDRLHARRPWYAALIARDVAARFAAPTLRRLVTALGTPHLFTGDELRELPMPTVLLWGRGERLLPAGALGFFRACLPRARVLEPDGFGHCPQLERPGALARLIADVAT